MMLALLTIRMSRPSAAFSAATSSAGLPVGDAIVAPLRLGERAAEDHLLHLVEPDGKVAAARRRLGVARPAGQ